MTVKQLKKELNNIIGLDDWEVHVLIKELPEKIQTTDCTRIGICSDEHVIVLGFGKCPHCKEEE